MRLWYVYYAGNYIGQVRAKTAPAALRKARYEWGTGSEFTDAQLKRITVRLANPRRKNRSGETKAFRRLQKEGMTPRVRHKLMSSARRRVRHKWYTDPRAKGDRSVTLKNMASVTIIRRRNGTVGIRGVKK